MNLPEHAQKDKMFCYCNSIFWSLIKKRQSPYSQLKEPFENGERYCWTWFQRYAFVKSMTYLVSFAIIFVNWSASTILRSMTRFYGYQSKPEEVYRSTFNLYWLKFVNSAIVIQVVYFYSAPNNLKLSLSAEHGGFSQEWYKEVGSTVALTLLITVITTNLTNIMWEAMLATFRCCDRSCTCNARRTKMLV